MTLAIANPSKPMTIEDYLNYDDGTDTRYELVNGGYGLYRRYANCINGIYGLYADCG